MARGHRRKSSRSHVEIGSITQSVQGGYLVTISRPAVAYFCAALAALTAASRAELSWLTEVAAADQAGSAASATAVAIVPDLGDPSRWMKTRDGKVIVTPDNFIRAESNVYFAAQLRDGGIELEHTEAQHAHFRGSLTVFCSSQFSMAARHWRPDRLARC